MDVILSDTEVVAEDKYSVVISVPAAQDDHDFLRDIASGRIFRATVLIDRNIDNYDYVCDLRDVTVLTARDCDGHVDPSGILKCECNVEITGFLHSDRVKEGLRTHLLARREEVDYTSIALTERPKIEYETHVHELIEGLHSREEREEGIFVFWPHESQ